MFEKSYLTQVDEFILGCDEVGRGCLAGPVVCASVVLSSPTLIKSLRSSIKELLKINVVDSKKISAFKRQNILDELGIFPLKKKGEIKNINAQYSIEVISNTLVDEINVLNASLLGMYKSYKKIKSINEKKGVILIDGNKTFTKFIKKPNHNHQYIPVVKGDSKSVVIGLASIIAKEYRDQLMRELVLESKANSYYGFEKNAGYPTPFHKNAISKFGITKHHRKTFKPVSDYLNELSS